MDRYAVARHEVQLAAILVLQVRNSFSFVHSFWAAGLLFLAQRRNPAWLNAGVCFGAAGAGADRAAGRAGAGVPRQQPVQLQPRGGVGARADGVARRASLRLLLLSA